MKNLKKHLTGILLCLFELLVGVLVLIDPMGFTAAIIITAGIGLIILGLVCVVKYGSADPQAAAQGQYLLKGLLALSAGCFCAFKSQWFLGAFGILLGAAIFAAGLTKIQIAMDMFRAENKRWFFGLIGAAISLVCAVVILKNPFATTAALGIFIGVSLIVEAVVDAAMLIVSNMKQGTPLEEEPLEEEPLEENDA